MPAREDAQASPVEGCYRVGPTSSSIGYVNPIQLEAQTPVA